MGVEHRITIEVIDRFMRTLGIQIIHFRRHGLRICSELWERSLRAVSTTSHRGNMLANESFELLNLSVSPSAASSTRQIADRRDELRLNVLNWSGGGGA